MNYGDKKRQECEERTKGYKFLGWQNGWEHVYFDEDGKVTEDKEKQKTFGYLEKDYPEYGRCVRLKHKTDDIQITPSGSTNFVICDKCKIYWKYDSSG